VRSSSSWKARSCRRSQCWKNARRTVNRRLF
jgi:hypothetical protein